MMDIQSIKRFWEEKERELLSPFAALSTKSRGRAKAEEECELRTCFQRDRDRILHSKSFRRLKHKSQVFLSPEGDHYRTRLTHTLEVAQIARTIARALRLNEDLVEAISLGHDLGHTPFGHAGEEALNEVHPGGFKHNEQSLRVVDFLERDGEGLNLTFEVRDGIVKHSKTRLMDFAAFSLDLPATLEGQVVRWADIVAYVNHDIDDALRACVIRPEELPQKAISLLGKTHRERINTMVRDIILESFDCPGIRMSEPVKEATETLRNFLFERVYFGPEQWEEREKAKRLVKHLYEFFLVHPEILEKEYAPAQGRKEDLGIIICDFISGMTDRYALYMYRKYFIPSSWPQEGWKTH
ncbi:MAG: deoxyguanosinetriphosphate triphosphohydrolase [Candidatus Caldatribacteriaceae bacterium]